MGDAGKLPGLNSDFSFELLRLIRSGQARTRGELGQVTGFARSTIANGVDDLMAAGLVISIGGAPSTGGRPASLLGFNGDAGVVLVGDLGATHSRVAVTDLDTKTLAEEAFEIDINAGPEPVLSRVTEIFENLLTQTGRPSADIRGIGIGLPGPVDFDRGVAVNPPIMAGWHEFPVARSLRDRYGVPVLVDNDVNIMAVGEHWNMKSNVDDLIFVKVGTGIGSGLILGGRLHRGAHGAAGDIGHVQAAPDDVLCRCGNNGCLEASAGGAALAQALRDQGHDTTGSRDVVGLVSAGDNDAIRAVRSAGRLIGQVLSSVVNLLNPSVIVIGGDLANAEQQLLAGIREVVYQRSTTLSTQDLQITTSHLGDRAGVTGASAMVIDHVLSPGTVAPVHLGEAVGVG